MLIRDELYGNWKEGKLGFRKVNVTVFAWRDYFYEIEEHFISELYDRRGFC